MSTAQQHLYEFFHPFTQKFSLVMPRLPTFPMSAMASESLPFELIMTILDKLAIPLENQITNGYHGESAVLAVCSLVCKEWSRHAQRLLFERVIISDKYILSFLLIMTLLNSYSGKIWIE